jgi:choline-glycine betaine transporter
MSDETSSSAPEIDWPVFMTSGGFIVVFIGLAVVDIDLLSAIVNAGFSIATTYFGAYWQGLLLLTFLAAILVCVSLAGRATLGGIETPEMSTFKWVAIIMCTMLAGISDFASFLVVWTENRLGNASKGNAHQRNESVEQDGRVISAFWIT